MHIQHLVVVRDKCLYATHVHTICAFLLHLLRYITQVRTSTPRYMSISLFQSHVFFIDGTIHIIAVSVTPHDGDSSKLWPASTRSSRVHREAALSQPSRCFKAGASERLPPLCPGINAALML